MGGAAGVQDGRAASYVQGACDDRAAFGGCGGFPSGREDLSDFHARGTFEECLRQLHRDGSAFRSSSCASAFRALYKLQNLKLESCAAFLSKGERDSTIFHYLFMSPSTEGLADIANLLQGHTAHLFNVNSPCTGGIIPAMTGLDYGAFDAVKTL